MSKILDLWNDMTGVVLDYALSTPPSASWLMCYGQPLADGDPVTAKLRAKLIADGFPHGQDGSANPLIPDARGRTTAGKDDMGGAAAGRLTAGGAGINGATLGASGGAQTHALTTAQLAAHNHGVTDPGHGHGVTDAGHAHSVYDPGHGHSNPSGEIDTAHGAVTSGTGLGYTNRLYASLIASETTAAATGISIYDAATGIGVNAGATGISTQNNGSGNDHNNTQPTLVLNKIIRL